ncbi:mucin TcMUCII [Trypanosoma cruzi cruzi]|uniref:Putative mucin TcMUCII n=1 Tax=Trypanosoma cruzi TaxID=5693 RepID=A0A2V2UXF8_TRYCR|nr:mucin TcMUCII [Trypanosoma cruzi cruzi]PBJ74741.1 mucin TcMUCII [Trypanosoma cruzi cruzi]PWU88734.1 putative mucin TcMUCII [Trypanosoma cruzi]PWU88737.1 putative mucin TcMUCII [Trypanosoma cruzi]
MMTCRLLCALLVLALCCCPTLCVTATGEDPNRDSSNLPPAQSKEAGGQGTPGGPESQSTSSKEQTGSGSQTSQGLSSGDDTAQNPGEKEAVGSNKPDSKEATSGTTRDNVQETGTGSAPSASPDSTSPGNITEQQPSGSANPVQQSQKANAPTTTTTTTTTAPEASSTTSTEAPTTTTTRAPSLLREIDGSLSSSAWVCAPLLLVLAALAYTTLG